MKIMLETTIFMSSTLITSINNNDLTNTDLPLYLTDHNKVLAKEALHVLESMISSLKDNDPLANYMRNVLESIKSKMEAAGEANSDSVIPLFIDEISTDSINIGTDHIQKELKKQAGVYLIKDIVSGEFYIGSANLFSRRLTEHKHISARPIKDANNFFHNYVKAHGGWSNFVWQTLIITGNHSLNFMTVNPNYSLTAEKLEMLRALTQFETKLYEQSMINLLQPTLNTSTTITYSFVHWSRLSEKKKQ